MGEQPATETSRQGMANAARDWEVAHEQLLRLARRRAGLDFDEGRWLMAAFRAGTHVRLGYASFAEYVERVLGYAPRLTHDKLRVAEALEGLATVPKALRDGQLSWSAVRELTRVATAKTEDEWLAAARGRTVRDVERLVSGHPLGSRPQDPVDPQLRRHVLRFEVSGETLAAFRDAMAHVRREAGSSLDDDAALLLIARQHLQGPRDEGRASYQLALTVCEDCRRARQHAHGELVDVGPDVLAMAECDGQQLSSLSDASTHVGRVEDSATATSTHVGRTAATGSPRLARARQDITPAVRRFVLQRDHGQCIVPGCRHATFVDIHHITQRAFGGDHDPDNLVTVCGAHHRAIHRGELILTGSVSAGLRVCHADGSSYGEPPSTLREESDAEALPSAETDSLPDDSHASKVPPDPAKRQAMAYRALRRMGFNERKSRKALDYALTHVGADGDLEQLIRRALQALTGDLARAS